MAIILCRINCMKYISHLHRGLHPLNCEVGSEIGSEGCHHEDEPEPVACNEHTARKRLGALSSALWSYGDHDEPQALHECEVTGQWVRGSI